MKKNLDGKKNLSLKTETVRNLTPEEMKAVNGGIRWYCWTIIVPSSGIVTTIPIARGSC